MKQNLKKKIELDNKKCAIDAAETPVPSQSQRLLHGKQSLISVLHLISEVGRD